jgi:hypothetical protein
MSYESDYTRIEYGVIVDRTSDGLGCYLAHTSESLSTAQMHAELQPAKYPVQIKTRLVTRTTWKPLATAAPTTADPPPQRAERVAGGDAGEATT